MSESMHGLTCDLTAIPSAHRPRHSELAARIRLAVQRMAETADGYQVYLRAGALAAIELGEWASMERLCCPFLRIEVEGHTVRIQGEKSVIRAVILPPLS